MNPRTRISRAILGALWVAATLSAPAFAGVGNNTFTQSAATQSGTSNSVYVWTTTTLGPANISVGVLTGCTLVGSPPFAGCNLNSGSGTFADPFVFSCTSPLALTGCSGGTPFNVAAGTVNVNTHTQTVVAVAPAPAQSVPLGPWVPLASAGAVLAAVLLLRRLRASL